MKPNSVIVEGKEYKKYKGAKESQIYIKGFYGVASLICLIWAICSHNIGLSKVLYGAFVLLALMAKH